MTKLELPEHTWSLVRDVTLFLFGLGGVVHETVVSSVERPALLIMFAAMMGLPAYLRTDEARKKEDDDDD